MSQVDVILPTESTGEMPVVRSIKPLDLAEVLEKGLQDFRAMPTHVVFLCIIYPVIGLVLAWATVGYDLLPLLYPLAAGFALVGPFAAIGAYELSRRRELGLDTSWKHAFDIIHSPSFWSLAALGLLLLAIFAVWLAVARGIYVANFGEFSDTAQRITGTQFATEVLTTPQGHHLIIIGNLVGFLFAVLAFSLSVVSFPLLLDRNVGVAVAIITSFKVILKNPVTMALWGLIVAVGLAMGFATLLVGLAVVVPVLGHSTWHLYRKVVEPDSRPRPEYHPRMRGERSAADFPVALFMPTSPAEGPGADRGSDPAARP